MPYNPAPTQGPLVFNVTVTNFVPIPATPPADGNPTYPRGFFTDADFALDPGSARSWVKIDNSRNPSTGRTFLSVCNGAGGNAHNREDLAKGIILHFRVRDGSGSDTIYRALDISFVQYEPNDRNNDDPNGFATFPPTSVSVPPLTIQANAEQPTSPTNPNTNILEVYNLWTGHNGNSNSKDFKWRFFLLIQRVSDGKVGIIDPDLQNEN